MATPKTYKSGATTAKRSKMSGNVNARRHGLFSPRGPAGSVTISRAICEYRRSLEAAVADVKGCISIYHASLIATAAECSKVALSLLTELRTVPALTLEQRIAVRAAALKAMGQRDRTLALLGLTTSTGRARSVFDVLDEQQDEEALADLEGSLPPPASPLPSPELPAPAIAPSEPDASHEPASGVPDAIPTEPQTEVGKRVGQ